MKSLYKITMEVYKMKKNVVSKAIQIINFALKVDANSTSTVLAYQPKVPQKLNSFKKNDK